MQGLGYKELLPVLDGKVSLEDAVSLIKLRTRHYSKRQLTWFKRDERIQWLPYGKGENLAPYAEMIYDSFRKE